MHVQFIILAVACNYLRKFLQKEDLLPQWQRIFLLGTAASIIIFLFEIFVSNIRPFTNWIGHFASIAMFWAVYTEPAFKSIRSRLYSVLPFFVLVIAEDLLKLISIDFYYRYKGYIDTSVVFAFIWMLVMLFITNKQKKALELEKKKAAMQERELQLSEKLKAQLEVQVTERTSELTRQKQSLEQAIINLKATQTQLIHAEKMASLGELTAGIAHEIQNPLNFVNNFSELNKDLIIEMKAELEQGNFEEAKMIAGDIKINEEKISFHGKRAEAIVKGMLLHSRNSSGQKELTDINALCDEYLRLAYHGLRAKDKSFNANFKTDFDEAAGKINVVPQDIGRVLLNLINNAFFAVSEKKKNTSEAYQPEVVVSTRRLNAEDHHSRIEISVKDNGGGMPQHLVDKIFQPFFTTKPAGQGTGLGLSLAYDIVTKGHGGEMKVKTRENEGSEFIIHLPAPREY